MRWFARPAASRAGRSGLFSLLAVASGCIVPGIPPLASLGHAVNARPTVEDESQVHRLHAGAGPLVAVTDRSVVAAGFPVQAALSLRLAPEYELSIVGANWLLGVEGDLTLQRGPRTRIGFLHGVATAAYFESPGSSSLRWALFVNPTAGILFELPAGENDRFFAGARYAYATAIANSGVFIQPAHYLLAGGGYSLSAGRLRVSPELLLGATWNDSSSTGPAWLILPSVGFSAPF
ncbi:MAG: hypothetical protein HYZ28_22955 [Myxococcales bacterium]|nr:hypothetical protein [Myxococcales bacterium]